MNYWLLYDISSQSNRSKIVRLCKDYGLNRVQKSCFFGNLDNKKKKLFEGEITKLAEDKDSICLVPFNQINLRRVKKWGSFCLEDDTEKGNLYFI